MTEISLTRRLLFSGAAITGALSIYIAAQTKFDSDLLSVLPADLPEVQGIQLYRGLFLDRADFLIVLECDDPIYLTQAAGHLHEKIVQQIPELEHRTAWQAPWSATPELGGELAAYARSIGDPTALDELAKTLTDPVAAKARVQDALSAISNEVDDKVVARTSLDPFGITKFDLGGDTRLEDLGGLSFASKNGTTRLITIDAPPAPGDITGLGIWDEQIAAVIAQWKPPVPEDENLEDGSGSLPSEELPSEAPATQDAPAEIPPIAVSRTGRAAYMVELENGMKWELIGSVSFTAVSVLLLFYGFYGRLRPLFSIAICLSLTCLVTFAVAGLLYERLGILSVGFAAILIGLVVDYGVVVYQELQATNTSIRHAVRLLLAPVFWAAFTTGGVFLFLARSAIPGIAQLGILVAVGVTVGAFVMILIFAPLAAATRAKRHGGEAGLTGMSPRIARVAVLLIATFAAITLATMGTPKIMSDPDTLKPTRNVAGELYNQLTTKLEQNEIGRRRIVVSGNSESEIADTLRAASSWAATKGNLPDDTRLILPTALWPDPDLAAKNIAAAAAIVKAAPAIRPTLDEWFNVETLRFYDEAIAYFKVFSESPPGTVPAPKNAFSDAILANIISRDPAQLAALGTFHSTDVHRDTDSFMDDLRKDVPGVLSAGWEHLAPQIKRLFAADLGTIVTPIVIGLTIVLLIVFRRPIPVALSFLTLGLSIAWLLAIMRVTGISWNVFNLASVPLLLGLGLDYAIHMNLAAARAAAGDLGADRRVARALLVCSLTSAVGFGSLAWSHHPGLSSLGIICGIGILLTMLTAVFIIPAIFPHRVLEPSENENS